jgi:hypothetical protein
MKQWATLPDPVHVSKCYLPTTAPVVKLTNTSTTIAEIKSSNPLNFVKSVRIAGGSDYLQISQLVVTDMQGNNIAVGRPTSSSGIYASEFTEKSAVNGNFQGLFISSTPTNAFFEVTLDKPTQIASVSIYNRKDCCQDRLTGYKVILKDSAGNPIYTSNNLNGNPQQTINIPIGKENFESLDFYNSQLINGIPNSYLLLFILIVIIIIYLYINK